VAVETIGNWYWIIDEIESAGMIPKLVHARKAKLMMGMINKTDKLDARGLNKLQRIGTLPDVWIPSGELRDKRDLTRTRMFLANMRTKIKNRIHSVLNKYALSGDFDVSDIFGKKGRVCLDACIAKLPPHTGVTTRGLLAQLDALEAQIKSIEDEIDSVLKSTPQAELLMSAPGIGKLLATVIMLEVGDISRFPRAEQLAGYSGTVPRVHASGGHVRFGKLRSDVNRYLKWAFSEAANSICVNRKVYPDRHVTRLYERIRARKGHQKAIGAVARHLSEAVFWMLTKNEEYKEPVNRNKKGHSSTKA
jgi:transposase